MNNGYRDIRSRITEPPKWWDECAVPRYCDFAPNETANIYSDEAVLVEIACQACGQRFKVCFSSSQIDRLIHKRKSIAEGIKSGLLHYGDPPNADCCGAGATMNCHDLRVLEYWHQPDGPLKGWQRDSALEIDLEMPITKEVNP